MCVEFEKERRAGSLQVRMNGSQHDFVGAAFVRAQIAAAKREGCRPHGAIVSRGLPRSNAVRTFLQKSKEMAPQANDANACAKKETAAPAVAGGMGPPLAIKMNQNAAAAPKSLEVVNRPPR